MDQRLDEENEIETQRRINRRERIDTTDEYHALEEFPDEGEEMKSDTENEHEEDKEDDKDGEETEEEKQEEKNKKEKDKIIETLIYPCAVCSIDVKKRDYGVRCDIGCGKWCHRKCSGLASINDWRSNTYRCPKCIEAKKQRAYQKANEKENGKAPRGPGRPKKNSLTGKTAKTDKTTTTKQTKRKQDDITPKKDTENSLKKRIKKGENGDDKNEQQKERISERIKGMKITNEDMESLKDGQHMTDQAITYGTALSKGVYGTEIEEEGIIIIEPNVSYILQKAQIPETIKDIRKGLKTREKKWEIYIINNREDPEYKGGEGTHWSIAVYHKRDGKFLHFDTVKGVNKAKAQWTMLNALNLESFNTEGELPRYVDVNCIQQGNAVDCGAYVLLHLPRIIENIRDGKIYEEIEFDTNDVKTLRKRIRDHIMMAQQVGLVNVEQQDEDKHGEEEIEKNTTKEDSKKKNEEKAKEKEKKKEKEDNDKVEEAQDEKETDLKDVSKSKSIPERKIHGQSKGMDQGKKKEPEKSARDERKKECWFWNNRKCKYGENCRDVHPTQCKIWLESGKCHDRGCNLSHPEICKLIYNSAYCNRRNCWFTHPTNIPNRYVFNGNRNPPQNSSDFIQQHKQRTNGANSTAGWTQDKTKQNQNWQWGQQSNQNNQNGQWNSTNGANSAAGWTQEKTKQNQNWQWDHQSNQNNQNNQRNSTPFLDQWPTPRENNSSTKTKMMLQQLIEQMSNTIINM